MLPGTYQREVDRLGEAESLAIIMVDQIEWVDVLDPPPGDDSFCREATAYVRRLASRDALKQLIERMANRVRGNALALHLLSPESLDVAAELLTSSVKAWLRVSGRDHHWVMRRRLVIKLDSIEAPWVQDPQRHDLANPTLHA